MRRYYKFLILLGIFAHSIGYSIESTHSASLIRELLQEANEMNFYNKQLRIELLKNCPETIPLLAEWEYQDWHPYDTSLTREKFMNEFNHCLNDDHLPLAFVILKGTIPIGIISLVDKSEPELSDLEDGNPWGDSFHVIPAERNRGIGQAMAMALIGIAKRLGYEKIHFYTSNSQLVGWYTKRGAKIIDTRPYRGHVITTLEYSLTSPNHYP